MMIGISLKVDRRNIQAKMCYLVEDGAVTKVVSWTGAAFFQEVNQFSMKCFNLVDQHQRLSFSLL